jgi:hypothetical protein
MAKISKWGYIKYYIFPLFSLSIELPFFKLRTDLMRWCDMSRQLYYYNISIMIFKWKFNFNLYEPHERMFKRKSGE